MHALAILGAEHNYILHVNNHHHAYNTDMLSGNILSWLVLLMIQAIVSSSEHYHIVPVDSIDLCHDYRNGPCFTLEQLVKTDVLSGGENNLTLSFLPGDHVLIEPFLIRNFSHVYIYTCSQTP